MSTEGGLSIFRQLEDRHSQIGEAVSLEMMTKHRMLLVGLALITVGACQPGIPNEELIFVDGRAVAPALDSVYAITTGDTQGVLLYYRRTGVLDTIGAEVLSSPIHTQWSDGLWYVSDVIDGRPSVVVFDQNGTVTRQIDLSGIASAPHQFAVLPDGRIVIESNDGRLVTVDGDSVVTFALTEAGPRTGLVVAARGGVLHAVAGELVTLYNGQGNIRWRIEWPWDDTIFAVDLAVDADGRTHLLAGQETEQSFIVFGFSPTTGEVLRWSMEGPSATFVVGRMGEIYHDSASNWVGGN